MQTLWPARYGSRALAPDANYIMDEVDRCKQLARWPTAPDAPSQRKGKVRFLTPGSYMDHNAHLVSEDGYLEVRLRAGQVALLLQQQPEVARHEARLDAGALREEPLHFLELVALRGFDELPVLLLLRTETHGSGLVS